MVLLLFTLKVLFATATVHSFVIANTEAPLTHPSGSALDYLNRALSGIGRALDFFDRSYKEVNLDALIGTRLVEDAFSVLLRRLHAQNRLLNVPPSVLTEINRLRLLSGNIRDRAVPYVMTSEPDYFANIGPILTKSLFELDYNSRNVSQTSPVWPHKCKEAYDEESSDYCMSELFGAKNGISCDISNVCWKQMTSFGYSGYSLSHELLYLEIAQRFGCQWELAWHIRANQQGSLASLHDALCSNMLREARAIAEHSFPPEYQDLFMEHAALCGMLGYKGFFNHKWLEHILSWQDIKEGCYRGKRPTINSRESDCKKAHAHERKKREEKTVGTDCQLHRTTVAVGALSQYVRNCHQMAHLLPSSGMPRLQGDQFAFYRVQENPICRDDPYDIPHRTHDYKWTDYLLENADCHQRRPEPASYQHQPMGELPPGNYNRNHAQHPHGLERLAYPSCLGHASYGRNQYPLNTLGAEFTTRRLAWSVFDRPQLVSDGLEGCPPIGVDPRSLIRPLDPGVPTSTRPTGKPYFAQETVPSCLPSQAPLARKGGFNYRNWTTTQFSRLQPDDLKNDCLPSLGTWCQPAYVDCCPAYSDPWAFSVRKEVVPY